MLKRLYELFDPVLIVLISAKKSDFILSNKEVQIISDIVNSLKLFFEFTKVLSSKTQPTVCLTVPYVSSL